MVLTTFRVNNKDIRTKSILSFSLVDFDQVKVGLDVIKSFLSDYWSILKILCIKCCPCSFNLYRYNVFMFKPFLNKSEGGINTRNTTKWVGKLENFFWIFVDITKFIGCFKKFVDEKKDKIQMFHTI